MGYISQPVPPQAGGTGIANAASHTITLANAFSTSGNFPITLTATGSTSVTLPTSGTLSGGNLVVSTQIFTGLVTVKFWGLLEGIAL